MAAENPSPEAWDRAHVQAAGMVFRNLRGEPAEVMPIEPLTVSVLVGMVANLAKGMADEYHIDHLVWWGVYADKIAGTWKSVG